MTGIQFWYFKNENLGSEYNSDILGIIFYLNSFWIIETESDSGFQETLFL